MPIGKNAILNNTSRLDNLMPKIIKIKINSQYHGIIKFFIPNIFFTSKLSKNIIQEDISSIFDIISKKDQFQHISTIVKFTVLSKLHLLYVGKEKLIKHFDRLNCKFCQTDVK